MIYNLRPLSMVAEQWTGENATSRVLSLIGHHRAVLNSFGQPVVTTSGEVRVVELDEWVCLLETGDVLVMGDHAFKVVTES